MDKTHREYNFNLEKVNIFSLNAHIQFSLINESTDREKNLIF
jgi:hypothetical protein